MKTNNEKFRNSFGGIILELTANLLFAIFITSVVFVIVFYGIKQFFEKEPLEPVKKIELAPKPKTFKGSIPELLKHKI